METWIRTSLILCVFGFLKEFRPPDPFFVQYLIGPWHNHTEVQVNQEIYPVMTYSQLSLLVVVFLLTDLLRYKPVIVIEGVSLTISSLLVVFGQNVLTMQLMSFFFGIFLATEVAYYTYIYAKVDRKHYQKVTSYTQTAYLMGRFSSSVLGQILVSTDSADLQQLNYVSITASALATIWSFFLPAAKRSIYFHADEITNNATHIIIDKTTVQTQIATVITPTSYTMGVFARPGKRKQLTMSQKCVKAYFHLWKDFKDAFTNMYVLKWCVWWSLATCGYFQAYLYSQVLWETINIERAKNGEELQTMYNGVVEAAYTIIGAGAAFACGWLRLNWNVLGEAALASCTLIQGATMVIASLTTDVYIAYIGYIVFTVLYYTMITIVNSEIAKHINEDSYGLIFGVNTFFALVLQTVLTVAVAGEGGLALGARTQFLIYGGYFVVLGAIFAVMAAVTWCGGKLRDQPLWLPKETTSPKMSATPSVPS